MFEITCSASGDRAEAETAEEALIAADTLAHDHADQLGTQGALVAARKSVTIVQDGRYEGALTNLAHEGYRAPLSAAWSQTTRSQDRATYLLRIAPDTIVEMRPDLYETDRLGR